MGEDKHQAQKQGNLVHQERISERTLHEVALIGGFIGIILGARVFNHKTSKPSFWPPVDASIVFWTIFLCILFKYGFLCLTN
jgi:uncharacterized membrane protein YsdA (DUF1294 family)